MRFSSWLHRHTRLAASLGLLLLWLVYAGLATRYLVPRQAIANLDFWYHIGVGRQVALANPLTLVDGLYPLGYPFLLARGIALGFDVLRVGQLLAVLGGAGALAALYAVLYRSTHNPLVALAGGLLLLSNGVFLTYATLEGNDMLAMGLQALSLAFVWVAVTGAPRTRTSGWLAGGGLCLGLAYLVRYTALLLLPLLLLYVAWHAFRTPRLLLTRFAVVLAAFLAVTAIQWIPSILVHSTPFFNTQAKNVWFGIYGQLDWVNNWSKVPDDISLWQVIALDPGRFVQHWWTQIRQPFTALALWPPVLHMAWIIAIPWLLLDRRHPLLQRLYFPLVLAMTMGFTALAWLGARFMLVPLWVQCLMIVWLLVQVARWGARRLPIAWAPLAVGLCLGAIALQVPQALDWLQTPLLTRPLAVNNLLRQAGMTDPARVATNDPIYHATDVPGRTHYAQTYALVADPQTADAILAQPAAQAWQFLVIDREEGVDAYARLTDAFTAAKTRLAPLALNDQRAIYCVLPCTFMDTQPVDWRFGEGMHLRGYRLQQTAQGGSLYLDWQADAPLPKSYKVSIRILDPAGATVAQIDGVPQQWTWPTPAWRVGEPVVDFYAWDLAQPCTDCRVAILVYDAETQAPLPVTTGDGKPAGPLIDLPAKPAAGDIE